MRVFSSLSSWGISLFFLRPFLAVNFVALFPAKQHTKTRLVCSFCQRLVYSCEKTRDVLNGRCRIVSYPCRWGFLWNYCCLGTSSAPCASQDDLYIFHETPYVIYTSTHNLFCSCSSWMPACWTTLHHSTTAFLSRPAVSALYYTILCERTNKKSSFFLFSIVVSLFYIYTKYMLNFFLRGKLLYARLCSFSTLVDARTYVCLYGRQAHHVKAGGMYDDVLNGLGVGSACRGDTRNGRLLAGFTATPRR